MKIYITPDISWRADWRCIQFRGLPIAPERYPVIFPSKSRNGLDLNVVLRRKLDGPGTDCRAPMEIGSLLFVAGSPLGFETHVGRNEEEQWTTTMRTTFAQ